MLVSMYFDDLTLQDWADNCHDSQLMVEEFFSLFGYPFATEK